MPRTSFADLLKTKQIVVPRIQRPYAQGRRDDKTVAIRKQLLEDIFLALGTGENLDFNLVYGNTVDDSIELLDGQQRLPTLELLDGQQRLTTLFLLHWYLWTRELPKDAAAAQTKTLENFRYETRTTTTSFCKSLAGFRPEYDETSTPSGLIRNCEWYRFAFECDSSVQGMLTMLDAIHEKYGQKRAPLHVNLDKLTFDIVQIGEFKSKEDLYIKMNARGLLLSPFENLKADLAGYLKEKNCGDDFITLLDSTWVNSFWEILESEYDAALYKFISRSLAVLYIVSYEDGSGNADHWKKDEVLERLYTAMESGSGDGRKYLGFEEYQRVLDQRDSPIGKLKFIFRFLTVQDNLCLVCEEFAPSWDKRDEIAYKQVLYKDMPHSVLVRFAAVILYICRIKECASNGECKMEPDAFRRWMRIAHNLSENVPTSNFEDAVSLVRKISTYSREIDPLKPESIYPGFVASSGVETSKYIREEREKAMAIINDPQWEEKLKAAEKHPFMRGDVHCLFSPDMSVETFAARFGKMVEFGLLDKDGVAPEFRSDGHLLQRAMLCEYTGWGELVNKTLFAENKPSTLKVNLKEEKMKNLLAELCDRASSPDDAREFLQKRIEEKAKQCPTITDVDDNFCRAVRVLRERSEPYDMLLSDNNAALYQLSFRRGSFCLARWRGKEGSRIVLDSDRADVSLGICKDYGYEFAVQHQQWQAEKYHFCTRDTLGLKKPFGNLELTLVFGKEHQIYLEVTGLDESCAECLDGAEWLDDRKILKVVCQTPHTSFDETDNALRKWLSETEEKLQELACRQSQSP